MRRKNGFTRRKRTVTKKQKLRNTRDNERCVFPVGGRCAVLRAHECRTGPPSPRQPPYLIPPQTSRSLLLLCFFPFLSSSLSSFPSSLLEMNRNIVSGRGDYRLEIGLRKRRWDRRTLTWRLDSKNINGADEYLLRNTLHRAFDEWQAVSTLRFEEKEDGPTDVVIAFERGKHDDSFPFDGKDGVVAHAFFPRDGRLHFDADEDWTLNSPQGVNLFQTAVHEVGHLLGLPHSSDPRAAMNVGKKPYDPDFRLGEDDIRSIRRLYPPEQRFKPYFSPFETISKTSHSGFPFPLPETVTSTSSDRLFRFLRV